MTDTVAADNPGIVCVKGFYSERMVLQRDGIQRVTVLTRFHVKSALIWQ